MNWLTIIRDFTQVGFDLFKVRQLQNLPIEGEAEAYTKGLLLRVLRTIIRATIFRAKGAVFSNSESVGKPFTDNCVVTVLMPFNQTVKNYHTHTVGKVFT